MLTDKAGWGARVMFLADLHNFFSLFTSFIGPFEFFHPQKFPMVSIKVPCRF